MYPTSIATRLPLKVVNLKMSKLHFQASIEHHPTPGLYIMELGVEMEKEIKGGKKRKNENLGKI